MKKFNVETFYTKFMALNKSQRKLFIEELRSKGINIRKIIPYTYSEAKGIRHLFFYFNNQKESIPYFLLDQKQLEIILQILIQINDLQ